MPLHDWSVRHDWEKFQRSWQAALVRHIQPQLPSGQRVYIGPAPTMATELPPELPLPSAGKACHAGAAAKPVKTEPDEEIAVPMLEPLTRLYVATQDRLVAALEVIAPQHKDRGLSRAACLARYLAFLQDSVHLLLVDVHFRQTMFSFADRIAEELQIKQPASPPPMAISYRVGDPVASGGRQLGIWRHELRLGQPLPTMPLPVSATHVVAVDLEQTYKQATAEAHVF